MGIMLKIFQVHADGDDIQAASGETLVEDAIVWLVKDFAPGRLANHASGKVVSIEKNKLVLEHSYYNDFGLRRVINTCSVTDWEHNQYRYEFVGTPEWYDKHFEEHGLTDDFGRLKGLVWTIAKAWADEYPDELGAVIPMLNALEGQPA